MASGEGSHKPRKHNFSASEISILMEKVEENLAILQSKFTNSVTNLEEIQMWSEITTAVNAVGVDKRTEPEVCKRWLRKENSQNSIKKARKLEEALPQKKYHRQLQKLLNFSRTLHRL